VVMMHGVLTNKLANIVITDEGTARALLNIAS
jgi:DNA-binding transcriptional regulator LsrR (DeoR family)